MTRLSRSHVRTYIAGLACAAWLVAAPAGASGTATGESPAMSAALANIHIDNFGAIDDHYFRGAQPKGGDFRALSAAGVKLVIDLAEEGSATEAADAKAAGMQFVRIPMTTHDVPSPAVIAQFLSLVTNPANQPVYVHCIGGRHRTGIMTAIYRMTEDGWNAARAFSEMEQFKFGAVFLHPEFKDFIDHYVALPAAPPAVSPK
jgi:protein tyrosine/serine phosphatase